MMFYIGNNTSEYRELLNNFDAMEPDRPTKAVVILFAMGNQLDTLLKLNAEGLETDDNLRYVMDAFVGHISTPGGYTFWQKMSAIDLYGDDVLNAVNAKLATMELPNKDFMEHLPWLRAS
ncbi:MAG TPA: hypothetical protein DDW59_11170 [Gammaproteobacteria bacterium]|nr:hypothetical protein [Gammaproteobacteria bacterium]